MNKMAAFLSCKTPPTPAPVPPPPSDAHHTALTVGLSIMTTLFLSLAAAAIVYWRMTVSRRRMYENLDREEGRSGYRNRGQMRREGQSIEMNPIIRNPNQGGLIASGGSPMEQGEEDTGCLLDVQAETVSFKVPTTKNKPKEFMDVVTKEVRKAARGLTSGGSQDDMQFLLEEDNAAGEDDIPNKDSKDISYEGISKADVDNDGFDQDFWFGVLRASYDDPLTKGEEIKAKFSYFNPTGICNPAFKQMHPDEGGAVQGALAQAFKVATAPAVPSAPPLLPTEDEGSQEASSSNREASRTTDMDPRNDAGRDLTDSSEDDFVTHKKGRKGYSQMKSSDKKTTHKNKMV